MKVILALKSRKNRLFLLFCLVKMSLADGSEIAEKGYFFCFLRLKKVTLVALSKKKKSQRHQGPIPTMRNCNKIDGLVALKTNNSLFHIYF